MNYDDLKEKMIKQQIQARGINNEKVINAMREIPRHEFVREKDKDYAYDDYPLPIGEGQTISQPYIVAYMTEYLIPDSDSIVLEIGTGSGYQTAILATLFKEVYTVEKLQVLQKRAEQKLKKLNFSNVFFKTGDGSLGFEEYAPFDRIIITGAIPQIPEPLEKQINKECGIIVAPVGGRFLQKMQKVIFKNGKKKVEEGISCVFVPITGEYGFKE